MRSRIVANFGGDAAATAVGFALGARSGSLAVASGVVGAANLAAAATGNKIYFDHLLPFITYTRDGKDLLVSNVFDGFFKAVTGRSGVFDGFFKALTGRDGLLLGGVQRIENFDFRSSAWGFRQFDLGNRLGEQGAPAGTMNMVFKDANPALGALQMIAANDNGTDRERMAA